MMHLRCAERNEHRLIGELYDRWRSSVAWVLRGLTFRYITIYLIISYSRKEEPENAISRKPSRALVWAAQARKVRPWSPWSPPVRQELDGRPGGFPQRPPPSLRFRRAAACPAQAHLRSAAARL